MDGFAHVPYHDTSPHDLYYAGDGQHTIVRYFDRDARVPLTEVGYHYELDLWVLSCGIVAPCGLQLRRVTPSGVVL